MLLQLNEFALEKACQKRIAPMMNVETSWLSQCGISRSASRKNLLILTTKIPQPTVGELLANNEKFNL